MKIFLIVFLILITAKNAFAQFHWSIAAQFNTQLFSQQTPLGERADMLIRTDAGTYLFNENFQNNHPNPNSLHQFGINRGHFGFFERSVNFFQYGRGTWGAPNQLRFSIGYRGDNVAFYTRTYLDRLVRINEFNANEGIGENDFFAGAGDQSLLVGDGRSPNWSSLLRYAFEEWYITGTTSFLTAFVGIVPNRGKVLTFNNQSEALLRGLLVENFGVIAPTPEADFVHDGLDTNNLLRSGAPSDVFFHKFTSMPYFMLAARVENLFSFPLTFQIAADPGNNSGIGGTANFRRMHGAFRVSAGNIGERVNIDAIYKIAGGDTNTLDDYHPDDNPFGTLQPTGTGIFAHNFGLYANVMDIFGFNFGLGFSGHLVTFEDSINRQTGIVMQRTGPLITGFDFRIQYAGIQNLLITSFNNISFGESDRTSAAMYAMGVTGIQWLPNGTAQDWLARFHSLTVVYNFTSNLSASIQFGYRYGIINTNIATYNTVTSEIDTAEIIRSRRQFGGGGFIAYRFSHFNVQVGFSFRHLYDSYSNTRTPYGNHQNVMGFRDASGGTFDIAIPIQLAFQF